MFSNNQLGYTPKMTVLVDRFQRNIIHTFNKLNSGIPAGMLENYHLYMKALSLNNWDPQLAAARFPDWENIDLDTQASSKAPFDNIDKFFSLLELLEVRPCDDLPKERLKEAFYIVREDGFRVPEHDIVGEDWILSQPETASLDQG